MSRWKRLKSVSLNLKGPVWRFWPQVWLPGLYLNNTALNKDREIPFMHKNRRIKLYIQFELLCGIIMNTTNTMHVILHIKQMYLYLELK